MRRNVRIALAVALFIGLLWLWPNVVHEQAHKAALIVDGVNGSIHYDWGFPPHPYVVRGGTPTFAGALFFLLAPSILSILVLVALFATRPNIWLHGALGTYLVFDLFMNIKGYSGAISDYRFLTAVPYGWLWSFLGAVLVASCGIILLKRVVEAEANLTQR